MTTEVLATKERETQNEEQSSEEPSTSVFHPELEASNSMTIHFFLFDLNFKNGHPEHF